MLPNFIDFVISDDSEKSHQNLSDYNQLLVKKRFEVNKKHIFSSEKIRNSGIYDYAHAFFGEYFNPMRYTGLV